VRERLLGECTGHDWFHVERVWRVANYISASEGGELLILQLAALLHDIADWKFNDGDEQVGPKEADAWLLLCGVPKTRSLRFSHNYCDVFCRKS
jgi:uncharacterized protein